MFPFFYKKNGLLPSFSPSTLSLTLCFIPLSVFAEDNLTTEEVETMTVTASALKVETPLVETPRSVSVIDETQLSIQQPTKLDEALRYQPGVMTQPYGSDNDTDWFKVRSFDAATYLDGNRLYNVGYYTWTLEPFGLERIEVLKGPSAILYGEAPPGGVINSVSKRPTYTEGGLFQLQLGTNNQQQLGVDITGLMDEAGDVRFRLVSMMSQRDGMLDDTYQDRLYLAPSLAWDISPDTNITFLASYKKDKGVPTNPFKPAYGTLIDTPEGKLDPSTNLGEPGYDKNENEQVSLSYELEHYLNDVWTLKQNARYAHTDLLLRSTYAFGSETSADLSRGIIYRNGTTDAYSMDNRAIAYWVGERTEHTFMAGMDLQYYKNESLEADDWGVNYGGTTGNINAFHPLYGNYQPIDALASEVDINKSQAGFYLQHQVKLDQQWIIKLGGRYDIVRLKNESQAIKEDIHNNHFSFSAGVMYQTNFGLTPYVSYDESFEVIASIDPTTGEAYKPLEGQQMEIGFKYEPEFINGYMNLAWFDISQKNGLVTTQSVATQSGELTSQGIELEGVVYLTDALLAKANYTYTDAKTDMAANADPIRTPLIPYHMASTWLEYDFTHLGMESFIVGVGARYMGSSVGHNSTGSDTLKIPSVTVFDAMARYDITPQWRAQLNINNLANKTYVSSCDYYCYYGEEMTALATLNYTW